MKKLLLTLTAVLFATGMFAQNHWTVDANQWPSETVVYAKLNLGELPNEPAWSAYEVAAFVENSDGIEEVRAVTMGTENPAIKDYADYNYYPLRVKGDPDADDGKPITFKMYTPQGMEYDLTAVGENITWDGEMHGTASALYELSAVEMTSFSLPELITMNVGETLDLTTQVTFTPEDATRPNTPFSWEYSDWTQYISVDEDNILTALAPNANGVSLTATLGNQMAGTRIVINNPATALTILPEYKKYEVNVGDWEILTKMMNAFYELTPPDATDQVQWRSSNTSVMRFDETIGAWNPIAPGTATMTAYIANPDGSDRLFDTMEMTVVQPVTGVTSDVARADIPMIGANVGDNLTSVLNALTHVQPANASNQNIVYSVITPEQTQDIDDIPFQADGITVTDGVVTAAKRGWSVVRAESAENPQYYFDYMVLIDNPAKDVTFAKETLAIQLLGPEQNITNDILGNLTFSPEGYQFIHEVNFESSDPSVLGVSYSGTTDNQGNPEAEGTEGYTFYGYMEGEVTMNVSFKYMDYLGYDLAWTNADAVPNEQDYIRTVDKSFTVILTPSLQGFTIEMPDEPMVAGQTAEVRIIPEPQGIDIDLNELHINIHSNELTEEWPYASVDDLGSDDEGAIIAYVYCETPGQGVFEVAYGEQMYPGAEEEMEIGKELDLAEGWQWKTLWSAIEPGSMETAFGNGLVEIRSQQGLMANDPSFGYFGDLFNSGLLSNECYKIKMETLPETEHVMLGGTIYAKEEPITVNKGWTWIHNPFICNRNLNDMLTPNTGATMGDRIVSFGDGFAEYTGDMWMGTLTSLKPGEGYLYNSAEGGQITFPAEINLGYNNDDAMPAPRMGDPIWKYDARRFRDNMSMVANIEGLNTADHYSVGAFVGDECRGEGKMINGLFFITAHANTGEQISFQLFDETTGEMFDIPGTVAMRMMQGTIREPYQMAKGSLIGTYTGIGEIPTKATADGAVYNVNGQRTDGMQHGVNIVRTDDGRAVKILK